MPPLFTAPAEAAAEDELLLVLLQAAIPVTQAIARRAAPPLRVVNLIIARRPST